MKTLVDKLHIGIAAFANPTLLIIGDARSLEWLAENIESRHRIQFDDQPLSAKLRHGSIFLIPVEMEGDVIRTDRGIDWKIDSTEAPRFAEQLRSLATSPFPAHAYLDTALNSAGLEVVASIDEYDPAHVFT